MSIRNQLSDPTGLLRKWFFRRTLYTFLCGLMAGLISWTCTHFTAGPGWEIAGSFLVGLAVISIILFGFFMGRWTSTMMFGRLTSQIGKAVDTLDVPEIQRLNWEPHDRLIEAIGALARYRAERYEISQAELATYRKLANEAPGLELFYDAEGAVQWMNGVAEAHFCEGNERPACIESFIERWVYAKDRAILREHSAKALQGLVRDHVEARFLYADGRLFWGLCRLSPRCEEAGRVSGVRFSVQDIQSRKDAETRLIEMVAALQRAQALKEHYLGRSNDERMRLSALLDIVKFGIMFIDRDRRVTYTNQAAADMWSLDKREEITGMRDIAVLDLSTDKRVDDAAYREHLTEVLSRNRRSEPYDILFRDGHVIREQSTPVPSADGRQTIGRVWVFEDVTEALQTQRRLTELAECDPLTGLLNRRRFHDELERQIADSMRRGTRLALVSIDFDGFKEINDRFGHQAGDEVLVRVTHELNTVIRRNEMFFRLGSDEFAILVPHAKRESVQRLAQRVIDKTSVCKFTFAEQPVQITFSLGLAFAPDHASDSEGLIHAADRAMQRAKSEGRNRWHAAENNHWNPVDTHASNAMPDLFAGEQE